MEKTQKPVRLQSLDVFRGLTVALMILVNTPGDWGHIYPPLEHSKWNGCTPTDVVFPAFLFMVGVSVVFALQSKMADRAQHPQILLKAAKRMLLLIAFGLGIQLFYHFDFAHLRYPGVLQRIGIVYFIVVLLFIKLPEKALDVVFWTILAGYYVVMTFVPVPDGHPANLGPATNLAAYIDRLVFTTNHISHQTKYWDAVGLLSTLPAICTGLLGVKTGLILKSKNTDNAQKIRQMLTWGLLTLSAGIALNFIFPINKQLWTSSYVLFTGGICIILLCAAFWYIDVKANGKWTWPLLVFGVNALTAYIVSEILPGMLDWARIPWHGQGTGALKFVYVFLLGGMAPKNASLLAAIVFVLLVWAILYPLYRKKVYLKI